MERASNMVNRDYYAEDGTRIKGSSLAAKVLANTPRTSKALLDVMQGRLDESNPMYQYLDEYRRGGLFQKYIQGQRSPVEESGTISGLPDASSRLEKAIVGYGGPSVARWLRSLGTSKNQVMRVLDGWNDFFQNAGAFAQFVTLREAGVPASRAARGVLEMMNLSHRGELTPYLRVLFPYVVPTVESGVALARTLGLGARTPGDIIKQGMRGYMGLLAAYGAYSMLYPLARESLGRDETGKYRMDAMSLSELVRGVPIGMGSEGDFIRFPVGFGIPQIAAMLVRWSGTCGERSHVSARPGLRYAVPHGQEHYAGQLARLSLHGTSCRLSGSVSLPAAPTPLCRCCHQPVVFRARDNPRVFPGYDGAVVYGPNEYPGHLAQHGETPQQ